MGFLEQFLTLHLGPHEQETILSVRDQQHSGLQELTFNASNVLLDFDNGTATVDDELDPAVSETVPLDHFFELVQAARPAGKP